MIENIVIEQPSTPLEIPEGEVVATNPIDALVAEQPPQSFDAMVAATDDVVVPTDALPIQEITPEIAAYTAAATDFRQPVEKVEQSLYSYSSPSVAIKDTATGIIKAEQEAYKEDFLVAAKRAESQLAERYARAWQLASTASERLDAAQALAKVTTQAVENVVTSSPQTVANNSVVDLAKVAKEQGLKAALGIQLEQKAKALGMDVSAKEAVGSIAAVLGGLYAASKVSGPVGWALGAGLTVNSLLDQKVIRDAIRKHANLNVDESWGITKHIDTYHKFLSTLPVEQALEIASKVDEDVLKNSDRIPLLGKVFASGNAASLHTGAYEAPGLEISARTRDALDGLSVVADAVPAIRYLKAIGSPLKSLEVAAGGNVAGKALAQDVVSEKNTLNIPNAQQVEYSLSGNFEQILPEGIKGTAGAMQTEFMATTKELLKQLDDRIAVEGGREVQAMRDLVAKHFELAPTSVARFDHTTGELVLQHPRGAAFVSEESARKFAAKFEAETGIKTEVRATNELSMPRLGTGEFVEGWHWSNKKLGAIKPSTEGAYGPGAYLYLDELPAARGAAMEGGWSHLIKTGFKVDDTIDVSVPLAEQSAKVQNVAKKLNITDVKDFTKVDQDVLRNEGLIGIGNSKDDLVGRAQVNVFAPEKLPVELRKQYFMAEDDVIQAAIDAAAKGDRAPLKALEAKVEVLRKTLEQSGTARTHFNGGLNMLQSTLPDVGKVVPGAIKPMLSAVAKKSSDVGYSTIAQRLSDLYDQIGLSSIRVGITSENVLGAWQVKGGKEYIKFSSKAFGNETTLLHETAHAATANILDKVARNAYDDLALSDKQLAAAKSILSLASNRELASTLRSATKGTMEASYVEEMLRSPHEFLAYGLSERGIIHDTLNKFVMDGKPAIHKLFQWMADLLGLRTDSALAKLHSDFFTLTDELADVQRTTGLEDMAMFAKSSLSHGYYVHINPSTKATHSADDIASRLAGTDPKQRASIEAVHDRFVSMLAEQRDKHIFAEYAKKYMGALNKAEFARVNKALETGDAVGKEFNDIDLFAHGIKTDKERAAYYAYRALENVALRVKNERAIKELSREGWFQGLVRAGGTLSETPVRKVDAATLKGEDAFDLATNRWVKVTGTETGLYRSRNNISVGSTDANLFLRTTDEVKIVPWRDQLKPLPGSYRRYYNQDHFGEVIVTKMVNGKPTEVPLNLRTSNSSKTMDQWVVGMNAILKEVHNNPAAVTLQFVEKHVGEWEDAQKILDSINRGEWANYKAGSFASHYNRESTDHIMQLTQAAADSVDFEKRARGIKLESLDKQRNILSPMDALGAELSNVARLRNVAEWRDKWVDTWWNTFKDTIDPKFVAGRRPIEVISDTRMQHAMYMGNDNAAKFAESQRQYILTQLGGQTYTERFTEGLMRSLGDKITLFDRYIKMPLANEPVHIGHAIRHADPLQFARSFNFHTMLGAFNPAQLIVQSQAMLNAVAISPVHGLKAAMSMPVIRAAMMSDNPAVWDKMAKASGMSAAEFSDVIRSLRKTGLLNGIGATSMHNIEAGAINMYNGMFNKIAEGSPFFFNRGEEAARITAFETARREFIATNKGVSWTTDDALKNILARTDDITQNMSRSNLAFYQRGLWSIPGQYLQYQIKLASNIIGSLFFGSSRDFTKGESGRILAAHLMAYGLAGNGLMWMYDEISHGYEKLSGQKLSQEQKLAVVEGGLSWMANELAKGTTGNEMMLGLGSRLGTFNWYHQVLETAVRADTAWWQAALGASATIPKKLGSLSYLVDPFTTGDLSPDAFARASNEVLKTTFSSWSNAAKAMYAYNNAGKLTTSKGVVVANLSGPEIIGQAMGIPAAEVQSWYRYVASEKEMRKAVKDFAKEYMRLDEIRVDLLRESGGVYNDRINQYTVAQSAIVKAVPEGMMKEFDSEKQKIWDMRNSETGKPRLLDKYVELMDKGVKLNDAPRIKEYGVKD